MNYSISGNYFDGCFHASSTTGLNSVETILEKYCPADLSNKLWECPVDYQHIDAVIDSAVRGFKIWQKTDIATRVEYLNKYREIVLSKKEKIATAIALETGRPLYEAHEEVDNVVERIKVVTEESLERIKPQNNKKLDNDLKGYVHYKPIGPSLVISPGNFPCHLANSQITAALAAGNSIIFKPSEKTCYSGQLLIECFDEAKFPKGVINLVQGHSDIAKRLLKERAIKGIFFFGTKESGKKVIELTNQDLTKMVTLGLGGKNTCIIHHDTNIDYSIKELIKACFLSTGQRCTSTSIVAIHDKLKDEFIDKFHNLAKKIAIDHPVDFEHEPFMGPLIDQQTLDHYLVLIGMAKREGIDEIMRGKPIEKKLKGHYVSPSIHYLDEIRPESHFLGSEIIGPSCTFISYKEIEQAVEIANSTEYGLATSIFTEDSKIAQKCLSEIESGVININQSTISNSPSLPFGGVKSSGNYRPSSVASIDWSVYTLSGIKVDSLKSMESRLIIGIDD